MKILDLKPGDVVTVDGLGSAVFLGMITPHPIFGGLSLVIWKLDTGEWSFDALSSNQELTGSLSTFDRAANLRKALLSQDELADDDDCKTCGSAQHSTEEHEKSKCNDCPADCNGCSKDNATCDCYVHP